MSVLPIVARELRVAARRRGLYLGRVVSAASALAVSMFCYLLLQGSAPSSLGLSLFQGLAWVCFMFALLAGVHYTAVSLTEEKSQGTLGLLFLTDLRGYDIVLGKLAAASWNSLYGLLAIVPVLSIAFLFGGVSGHQIWRVSLMLITILVLSLAVGVLWSALLRDGRRAAALSFLWLFALTIGPPLGALLWSLRTGSGTVPTRLLFASPAYAFFVETNGPGFSRIPATYWASFALFLGGAGVCLVSASLILPRTWQDAVRTPRQERWRGWWRSLCYGGPESRRALRRALLRTNPFFWFAARDRVKPVYFWLLLGLGIVFWLWGLFKHPRIWRDAGAYITLALAAPIGLKFWMGAAVVRPLAEDRDGHGLELLLSTPLTIRQILQGHWHALAHQFGWPVVIVLLCQFLSCLATLNDMFADRELVLAFFAMQMIFLVADAITIAWIGPWVALNARDPSRAAAGTLIRVILVPWCAWMGTAAVMHVLALISAGRWELSEGLGLGVIFIVGLISDVAHCLWARRRLWADFRTVASQRFVRRSGWFQRLFGAAAN